MYNVNNILVSCIIRMHCFSLLLNCNNETKNNILSGTETKVFRELVSESKII